MNHQKPLYQPWNDEEFSGDRKVRRMPALARWMYRALLQSAFFCSTRPYLPADDDELWALADCDTREQWMEHKDTVLQMFALTEIDGQPVYAQKRVVEDWQKLVNLRSSRSQAGRLGGEASSWQRSSKAEAELNQNEAREVKVSEEKKSESEENSRSPLSLVKGANLKKRIPELAREHLGVRVGPYEWAMAKDDFKQLSDIYGGSRVLDVFEEWAKENAGQSFKWPLLDFVKVADGLLRGIIAVRENPELPALNARLVEIGGQAFGGKYYQALAVLLKEYSSDEIVRAYQEFVDGRDDYRMQTAVKEFAEGGAAAVILAQRARLAEAARQRELAAQVAARAQEEGAAAAARFEETQRSENEQEQSEAEFWGLTDAQDSPPAAPAARAGPRD